MKWNQAVLNLRVAARQSLAVTLAFFMVPFAQLQVNAQDAYSPLGAEQLNQLVAPIALYPDSLVAQVLTAATYPQQVTDANNYVHQNDGLPPDQMAASVDGLPWDPSVKALTAFPAVLDNLARNIGWTTALGNAYYNQPADVMNAVQAMRYQAERAGNLRSSSQLRVYDDAGQIVIAPVDPAYVYVPYYNPWVVYGAPLPAYAGYYWAPPSRGLIYAGVIGFAAVAIGVGIWAHYNWGWHAWSSNWRGGNVYYNRNTYISNSTTVYNRGNFGSFNRGVYEREGAGVPHNFHPPVTGAAAGFRGGVPAGRSEGNFNRPAGAAGRPAQGQFERPNPNFNRPGAEAARPAQGQFQGRPPAQTQARPPAQTQARPEYRAPAAQARPYTAPAAPQQHAQPNAARPSGGEVRQQAARPPAAEHRAAPPTEHHAAPAEHKEKK
ncbi:MAG TPA: DUF3300 domain-containing protein [Bryobacteraceae bacterium]|nr:DUF3300 domain-containing protein [Bryobacteraceae bacterium]